MKVQKHYTDNHQVEIITEVSEDNFNQSKITAVKKISSESKIPGFRPGKAPYEIVKSIYGEDLIEERAIELLINRIYPQILEEADVKPYGPGKLEEVISKNPLKLKFSVPLEASVELCDYKSIHHPYKLPQIKESEIESVIQKLQLNYASAEAVNRQSEAGDLISIKINAFLTKPDEGQSGQILNETPHQVIIGDSTVEEQFPFPGFSQFLKGLGAGDTKEFLHKYPEDSSFENLQGKEVNYNISVENVKELVKPNLDDSFASSIGFDSLQAMQESIRQQLIDTKTEEYDNQYFNEVFSKLAKKSKIKYPPQMLEEKVTEQIKNIEKNLARQNIDFETYLKINNLEKEKYIKDEIQPIAAKRIEESLIVEEISRLEKIDVDQTELRQEFSKTMLQMQTAPNYKKLQKEYTMKKLSNILAMQTATKLLNRRTLDRIKAIANGEIEAENDKHNEISNKNMMDGDA